MIERESMRDSSTSVVCEDVEAGVAEVGPKQGCRGFEVESGREMMGS